MKRFFVLGLTVVAVMPAVALLLGFANSFSAFADSLSHFRHYLTAATFLAGLAMVPLKAWRVAGALAIAGTIGLGGMLSVLVSAPEEGTPDGQPAQAGRAVTLVQLNLLFSNRQRKPTDFLFNSGADIITLQEVSRRTRWVMGALKDTFPYQLYCEYGGVGGVAILSKFPPVGENAKACYKGYGFAWMRIDIDGRPVTVSALHLHWPYPFGQWRHVDLLEGYMRAMPRPVILGGDFNASPWSHSVARILSATDTDLVGGLRMTIHLRLTPLKLPVGLPIDHVMSGAGFRPVAAETGRFVGSDHRPVVVKFVME